MLKVLLNEPFYRQMHLCAQTVDLGRQDEDPFRFMRQRRSYLRSCIRFAFASFRLFQSFGFSEKCPQRLSIPAAVDGCGSNTELLTHQGRFRVSSFISLPSIVREMLLLCSSTVAVLPQITSFVSYSLRTGRVVSALCRWSQKQLV